LIRADEDSDIAIDVPRPDLLQPVFQEAARRGESSDGSGEFAVDGPVQRRPRLAPAPQEDDESAVVGPGGIARPADQRDLAAEVASAMERMPRTIGGMPVTVLRGRSDSGHQYHARASVACPTHPGCSRSRSCAALLMERFGAQAAALYLSCWSSRGQDLSAEAHRAYPPTVGEMQARAFRGEVVQRGCRRGLRAGR
jgi:hypothetical protein